MKTGNVAGKKGKPSSSYWHLMPRLRPASLILDLEYCYSGSVSLTISTARWLLIALYVSPSQYRTQNQLEKHWSKNIERTIVQL